MSAADPKPQHPYTYQGGGDEPPRGDGDAEPIFSPELRASLRRELGPSAADRARVGDALWSSVATGTLSPAAQRVDALLQGHAAAAVGGKAAAKVVLHAALTKTTKLVVLSVLVAGGTTAVIMRGPEAPQRAAVEAPASADQARVPQRAEEAEQAQVPAQVPALDGAKPQPAAATEPASTPLSAASPRTLVEPPSGNGQAPKLPTRTASETTKASKASKPSQANQANQVNQGHQVTQGTSADARDEARRPSELAAAAPTEAAAESSELQPSAASTGATENTLAPAPAVPASQPETPSAPKHELAAELALVRAASAALQRGDAQQALAQLQRHATRFPNGALGVEAEALRAIALCRSDAAAAAAASGRFLAHHPGSPLAERVRQACDQGSKR